MMVIYMALRAVLLARILLVTLNLSFCHPLPFPRLPKESGSYGRMTMLKKSCVDSLGNMGICMFKWDCISQKGLTLSTCVDGFLFGACCSLKEVIKTTQDVDSYLKTRTSYKPLNTDSLLESVTLSNLPQKTKSTASQEYQHNILSKVSSNSNETFSVSLTLDSFVETVNSSYISNKISFINNISTVNTMLNAPSTSSIYEYSLRNTSKTENKVHGDLHTEDTEFDSATKQILEDYYHKLLTEYNASNFHEYKENSRPIHTENYTTVESKNDSLSILQSLRESVKNELFNHLNSGFVKWLTNYDSHLKSKVTKANFTNLFPYTDKITNTLSTPVNYSEFSIITTVSENEKGALQNRINDKIFIQHDENATELNNSKAIINATKGIENVTSNDTSTSIWNDYTSLFPSSFQALISQLTSREVPSNGANVFPTIQSNLTYNLNINDIKKHEFPSSKNQEKSIAISTHKETDKMKHTNQNSVIKGTTTSNVELENHGKLESTLNSGRTDYATDSVSTIPYKTDLNAFFNHITNLVHKTTDIIHENLSESVSENDLSADTIHHKSDFSYTTISLDNNESSQKIFQAFSNEENELLENCTIHNQNYDNAQHSKLSAITDINTKESDQKNKYNFNSVTDASSSYLTTLGKIHETSEKEKFTTLSLNFDTEGDELLGFLNPFSTFQSMTGERDTGHLELQYEENTSLESEINSVLSSISNEKFLLDLTTEVAQEFFISDESDFNYPVGYEENLNMTTNDVMESSISSKNTVDSIITPSHASSQVSLTSSTEATILFDKIVNVSQVTDSSTEIDEKIPSDLSIDYNSYSIHFNTDYNLKYESTSDADENFETKKDADISSENNLYTKYFNKITNFDSSTEKYIYTSEYIEKNITNSLYDIESENSLSEGENIAAQNIVTTTFNLWENFTFNIESVPALSLNTSTSKILADISSTEPLVNVSDNFITESTNSDNITLSWTRETFSDFHLTVPIGHNITNFENHTVSVWDSSLSSKSHLTTQKYPSNTPEETLVNNVWNYKNDCGVRPIQPVGRIVGGRNTYFGKWPWQALVKEATWLGLFVKNKCGGVLITSQYILTAAHCQPGFLASLFVVLGTHDLSDLNERSTPVIRNVKRMVVHRHYNPQTFENDLALLELDSEIEFLPNVLPICLPHRNEDFTGEMAFVTGWGKLTHGGDVPNILQEVQVPIVTNKDCQKMFYQAGHQKAIQNNFVCAGYTNGGQDSCEGDSGGPLMVQRREKRWVLVGTVSHGIGCADPNLPGVYMRMSSYRPWIDSIIKK